MSRDVHIADAVKTYGDFNAVDHVTIDIQTGRQINGTELTEWKTQR